MVNIQALLIAVYPYFYILIRDIAIAFATDLFVLWIRLPYGLRFLFHVDVLFWFRVVGWIFCFG